MPLDSDSRADLERLFTLVRVGPAETPQDRPSKIVGMGSTEMLFVDDAYTLLGELVDRLAGSALAKGGRHGPEVESLITTTCRMAVDGEADPIGWLDEQLDAPLRPWLIGKPFPLHMPCEELRIGGCRIRKDVPEGSFPYPGPAMEELNELAKRGVIVTEVEAFDRESAYSRARDLFAEARAVVGLLSSRITAPGGPHFAVGGDERFTMASRWSEVLLVVRRVDSEGNVWPGYAELAEAAGTPVDRRTDWERRTLGAARWWFQAATQTWPSAALVAAMSAIEALLSFPGERIGKDKTIAKRLVEGRARVRGVEDVGSWFRQLHGRWRNNAAHDARFYLEDREVVRIVELSESIVRWAVGHLDPWHQSPYGACTTIEEAHGPHDTG